jgi:glycosyltransferase involved in cell wall biosynthesis
MQPVPIGIVVRTFEPGGTERQMIELIRRLPPARWQVHVACFRAVGAWRERAIEAAASVTEFPVRSFLRRDAVVQLRRFAAWCVNRRLAILQTSGLPTNLFALPGAALARVPVRLGARREINANRTAAQIALQRAAYACASRIVANSEAVAARLRSEGISRKRITVVPNGLDLDLFAAGRPTRPPTVITVVANLRVEKQHDVLIDAAPAVLSRFTHARFECVGDGPERGRLETLVAARGLSSAFTFRGHQPDVPGVLAAADVFVLPSRSEGFPNVVLEAMASGLPVIASALPATREVIEPEQSGLLVPSGDSRALADAICRVMGDPSFAARLGQQARAAVATRFSFDRMVAAFEQVYDDEMARSGASSRSPRRGGIVQMIAHKAQRLLAER